MATASAGRDVGSGVAIRRLVLNDFRSYQALRIELQAGVIAFAGPNGAGKTNLLEAVSLLTPGRGLRRARTPDLRRQTVAGTAPAWSVAARVDGALGAVDLATGLDPAREDERRVVRIDGEPARGQVALADHLACVWLTPQMDGLFVEAPAERRRFLDRLVLAGDPAHAGRVAGYESAMRQRLRLLREGRREPAWLSALEDTMATRGVAVAAARREALRRLNQALEMQTGPFPAASCMIAGETEEALGNGPALAAEDALREALARARDEDASSGTTGSGPHRSDLMVTDRRTGLPAAQGSTGEQKALLVSMVLGFAQVLAEETGAAPLLLLDEVAAHLDADRRAALFAALLDLPGQVWLTGTDAEVFAPLAGRHAQLFRVEAAQVRPDRNMSDRT